MCSDDCGVHTNDMPSAVALHTDSMPTSPLGIDDVASSSGVTAHKFIYSCGLQECKEKVAQIIAIQAAENSSREAINKEYTFLATADTKAYVRVCLHISYLLPIRNLLFLSRINITYIFIYYKYICIYIHMIYVYKYAYIIGDVILIND